VFGAGLLRTFSGEVMDLVGSRPYTTGLAAAIAVIVALTLVTAPPPGGAARTEPPVVQAESQVVQLEALIRQSAATLERSISTRVPSDRAVAAADITTAAVSTAGTMASQLNAAGSPTPITGSSTSLLTRPAATRQRTANAALATTAIPITTIWPKIQAAIIQAVLFVESVALLGFLLVGTLVVFIADALGFCLFGCPPSVVAPAAASEAAVSPVQTKPVVNKLVERVTTTVNAVKARTSAAPIPRTVRPKPLSSAVKGGPVVGKPQVSRHAPSGHSGLLRTAVRSRTSNLSNAVKHAIGTTRKKVQNSLSRIAR
jgi:hypothetical protein